MISLRDVEKSIGQGLTRTYLLRSINLDIPEGDFVSIMGRSGAGKSTLLHLLGMYDMVWSGEYSLFGNNVHKLDKRLARLSTRLISDSCFRAIICWIHLPSTRTWKFRCRIGT